MATIDRIDPAYAPWTPSAAGIATDEDEYVGRHRKLGTFRGFSFAKLFYVARHRVR
jgi:hypothetical protein